MYHKYIKVFQYLQIIPVKAEKNSNIVSDSRNLPICLLTGTKTNFYSIQLMMMSLVFQIYIFH